MDLDRLIFETNYWQVLLAEDQTYLGRAVIILKRPCSTLSGLSAEEFADFYEIVKRYEKALANTFQATMFNWTCLMNDYYKEAEPKPQVHWHCRPRYKNPVNFSGEIFADPNFGHHYERGVERKVSKEIKAAIISEIKKFV